MDGMTIEMLYCYLAARDDGMNFAVGATYVDGPVNGCYALFSSRNGMLTFVNAMRAEHGMQVSMMPSGASSVSAVARVSLVEAPAAAWATRVWAA